MIKKIFHTLFALASCLLWCALLGVVYYYVFLWVYDTNILLPRTYKAIAAYWNNGGVIKGPDALMLLCLFSYLPLFLFGCYKIFHFKFTKLITVPLNWLSNLGLGKYADGMPEVNIKNLKVEEKKTIEQIVQERIEQENKKNEQKNSETNSLRQDIIEKIEKQTK